MPNVPLRHRAADALPATLSAGDIVQVRRAATAAAERLGIEPALAGMSPTALRALVLRLAAENNRLGGQIDLPVLAKLDRRALQLLAANLRAANTTLRQRGAAASARVSAPALNKSHIQIG